MFGVEAPNPQMPRGSSSKEPLGILAIDPEGPYPTFKDSSSQNHALNGILGLTALIVGYFWVRHQLAQRLECSSV